MRRGTTPTHTFKPKTKVGELIDMRSAQVIYMTYKQDGKTVLEKTKDQMEITEEEMVIHLTQEDTLAFSTLGDVEIECRARFADQSAIASCILKTTAQRILKDGVI